jgi:seryl-tRNA synthetase
MIVKFEVDEDTKEIIRNASIAPKLTSEIADLEADISSLNEEIVELEEEIDRLTINVCNLVDELLNQNSDKDDFSEDRFANGCRAISDYMNNIITYERAWRSI